MSILSLLSADNFITVNKKVIEIVGLEAAVIFGELASESLYWSNNNPEFDGFFYSTVENIESKTLLSEYKQRIALAKLHEEGWIEVISKKGTPPKRYIKINEEAFVESLNIQNLKNSSFKTEIIQDSKLKKLSTNNNIDNKNIKKESIKEIINNTEYSDSFRIALQDFVDMRTKMKKPVTNRALKMLITEAGKLADNKEEVMTEIFNQSTQNSWLGVYPLTDKKQGRYKQKNRRWEPTEEFLKSLPIKKDLPEENTGEVKEISEEFLKMIDDM